jgi:hypothetical protein
VVRSYELLETPFSITRALGNSVKVPTGEYRFGEYRTIYYIAPHRPVAGRLNFIRGTYYNGDRTEIAYNGRVNLGSRFGLEPRIQYDWIDLPVGSFTTKLVGARVGLTLNPRMAFSGLVQFSSAASSLTSNVRFRWEYQPGSDFYVVYTDGRDTRVSGFPGLQNRSLVLKFTRMMRW